MTSFNLPQEVFIRLIVDFCDQNSDVPHAREFAAELLKRTKSAEQSRSCNVPVTKPTISGIDAQLLERSEQLVNESGETLYRIRLPDIPEVTITIYWHLIKDDENIKRVDYVFFENGVFWGSDELEDFMRTMFKFPAEYNPTRSGKQFYVENDYIKGYVLKPSSQRRAVYGLREFRAWANKS